MPHRPEEIRVWGGVRPSRSIETNGGGKRCHEGWCSVAIWCGQQAVGMAVGVVHRRLPELVGELLRIEVALLPRRQGPGSDRKPSGCIAWDRGGK